MHIKTQTYMTIANILNLITLSNNYHKEQMDKSFKKKSQAEKLKEGFNVSQIHKIHKTILETKLKTNFVNIISPIAESEFNLVFRMFF